MNLQEFKTNCMVDLNTQVQTEYQTPRLKQLFFEVTSRCNLYCKHCGSSCDIGQRDGISVLKMQSVLQDILNDSEYRDHKPFIILTGGEPMLRSDFFDIAELLYNMGFKWGMTTNGTLITPERAKMLRDFGMYSVSISIDGLRSRHDAFRQKQGAFDKALRGVESLIDVGGFGNIMVTTVLTHESLKEIDDIFNLVNTLDIDCWRVASVEPIGRALSHPEMNFTDEDYRFLLDYIVEKRKQNIPVQYGCAHYLGLNYEREVRDWFYRCVSGVEVASIMQNGDIGGCLNIERTKSVIQGNIYKDRLLDIWRNKFEIFRTDLSTHTDKCVDCEHKMFCRGGNHHTYDHEHNRQNLCMRGVLF